MKAGDIINLTINDIGCMGEGIGSYQEHTVFVPYALPEEDVKAKVVHVKKSLIYAELISVIKPSPYRKDSQCPVFCRCGGCDYRHISYDKELFYKRQNLVNILRKNAGYTGEVNEIVSSEPLSYRNKIQLPFGKINDKAALGFYLKNTHSIVPISSCPLHGEWAEKLIRGMLNYSYEEKETVYEETTHKGKLRHLVARYIDGHLMVTIVINGDRLNSPKRLIDMFALEFTDYSLYLSVNTRRGNVIMGDKLITLVKSRPVNILGLKLNINPMSFFQINDLIRDRIYSDTVNMIKPDTHSIVIDAYSGVGLLGAILAKRGARVYNIEIVPEAIKDADELYSTNNLSAVNILGDAANELNKVIRSLDTNLEERDLNIILDPPRKGVSLEVISALNNINIPARIIYISCNPATLSRDLALLTKSDKYAIQSITSYDMFPRTCHLETLVCLSRKV